ncbi:hypothetical protein OU5_P0107 (plasmid) [Pseudomonas mandelii JR-1]|uniref:Uncharacterized protein n=1 Tax=Pseudomonas mandelii JR-1 TaxID=1147786 RepID=A0A024EKA0_9PSED|nr:hypothetical protein OU5_P0107 [Pseudomonas mandelii JR-1]
MVSFDRVDHDILMGRLSKRIADWAVIRKRPAMSPSKLQH